MANKDFLIQSLREYHSTFKEELFFKERFLELLAHPRAFYRDHLPGHITASSLIVDATREFTLLTHHAKLNRWLQPGGHADGDEDTLAVAQREAYEETGLTSLRLIMPAIFDIDIHLIRARSEFPQHDHYDIRFLFEADRSEPLTVTEESINLEWVTSAEIPVKTGNNASILRMREKLKYLS